MKPNNGPATGSLVTARTYVALCDALYGTKNNLLSLSLAGMSDARASVRNRTQVDFAAGETPHPAARIAGNQCLRANA
jgi:hypothetical protein